MPSLKELSNSKSRDYAGRKGFGTRLFIDKLNFDVNGAQVPQVIPKEDNQLFGIRDFRGPNIVTNPVVLTHNQLRGGFVHTVPGLRDAGSLEFEANFFPWALKWERESSDGFMRSLNASPVDDEDTMLESILSLPSKRGNAFYFQGYASMMGPITYPQENVMSSPFGIKVSGKPFEMTPYGSRVETGQLDIGTEDFSEGVPNLVDSEYYLARILSPGVYDIWSMPTATGNFQAAAIWDATELAEAEAAITSGEYFVMVYACPWLNG